MTATLLQADRCPVTVQDISAALGEDVSYISDMVELLIAMRAVEGPRPTCKSIWAYDDKSMKWCDRGGVLPVAVGPYYERQMMADTYPKSRVRDVVYMPDPAALAEVIAKVCQNVRDLPEYRRPL